MGVFFTLAYKGFKFYLRESIGLDPSEDYQLYEGLSTGFRFLNSCVGVGFCIWYFRTPRKLFAVDWNKLGLMAALFPLTFFILKLRFFGLPVFELRRFFLEIPINLFTGISEEFVFRGMILFGLMHYMGKWKAIIFSSLYFMLWHYDVVQLPLPLFAIFLASVFFCVVFVKGASLLTLSIVHFLYDQIHYGLGWEGIQTPFYTALVCTLNIILIRLTIMIEEEPSQAD